MRGCRSCEGEVDYSREIQRLEPRVELEVVVQPTVIRFILWIYYGLNNGSGYRDGKRGKGQRWRILFAGVFH